MSFLYVRDLGRYFIKFLLKLGNVSIFFIQSLYHCFAPPYYFGNTIKQIIEIGFFSLPIVGLTGAFVGSVIVLQSTFNNPLMNIEQVLPQIVTTLIIKDLGPILISFILIGKAGASIAAEIGTMRITEQVDALITLNINPFKYLIAPRILASVVVFPILTICSDFIGIFASCITAVVEYNHNLRTYTNYSIEFFSMYNFTIGLMKSIVFGMIISISSCYYGYHCQEGARGVGIATTSSVMLSSILIIFTNYIITLAYA